MDKITITLDNNKAFCFINLRFKFRIDFTKTLKNDWRGSESQ